MKRSNEDRGFGVITPDDLNKEALGTREQGDRQTWASSGKKKTTMAKLTRESKLRERRLDKQAKKDARKRAPAHHPDRRSDTLNTTTGAEARPGDGQPCLETVGQVLANA